MKQKKYLVTLSLPLHYYIDANSKDEATQKAEEIAILELQGLAIDIELDVIGVEKF